MRKLLALFVPAVLLLATLALVTGCTDDPSSSIKPGQNSVALKASVGDPELLQLVDVFVLTVTGRDMDPVVDTLYFDGRYISGEVSVPAGDNRLFVLQGIQFVPEAYPGIRIIYEGRTTASVRPDAVTPLPIAMVPMVPIVKLSPVGTTVESGSSFSVDLKIYNVPSLVALYVTISFDNNYVSPESAVPSPAFDPSVIFRAGMTNSDYPEYEVYISDNKERTGIVDADGYATLATITFSTSGIVGEPVISYLSFNRQVTSVEDADSVSTVDNVLREESQVTLTPLTDRPVNFVDETLLSQVQNEIARYDQSIYGRQMMLSDVLPITDLSVVETGVQDLTGIEDLINLEYFNLDYCNVTDFTPLASIPNLRYLEVQGNKLTDISTIASVKQLEELDLSYNAIADIGAIENLTNLTYLNLRSNRISDLLPLLRNSNNGGFGDGDTIDITANALDPSADAIITELTSRGVTIIDLPQ